MNYLLTDTFASSADNAPDDDARRRQERRLTRDTEAFFNAQLAAILATVRGSGSTASPGFWREQDTILQAVIGPILIASLLGGADTAEGLLPDGLKTLANADFVNRAALRYVEQYGLQLARNINATTRQDAITAITEWMRSGQPLENLIENLTPLFGRKRAELIGITEVTNAYAEGNIILWQSTGYVQGKIWRTAMDERVCPICGPLEGQIVELTGSFQLTGDDAPENLLKATGGIYQKPPAHPRCRCWLQPFVEV